MNEARVLSGYRWRLFLLALPMLAYTLYVALRDKDARYFCQRLGFRMEQTPRSLWVHCASVGEVNAARPMIERLHQTWPSIIVTTNTTTGAQRVDSFAKNGIKHAYLPLDFCFAMRKFFRQVKPVGIVVLETELWPNLYACANEFNLKPAIVNARLSHKTLNAKPWMRRAYQYCLKQISAVLAKSERDAEAFISLGAPKDKVQTVGNIKLAQSGSGEQTQDIIGRSFVLAASTHPEEEKEIALIWRNHECAKECLLVIAPRHTQRGERIAQQLRKHNIVVSVRSRGDPIGADTDVYIADTLGELDALYAHAQLAVMGGSFANIGGHNILEPAHRGAIIICGPHMHNFKEELDSLLTAGGITQIESITELESVLDQFHNGALDNTATMAKRWSESHRSVMDDYLSLLAKTLPPVD
ncbi:MAG: glycosyltransferase N-terminal domain-containing protein [Pseudomonadota bacterium]